MKRGQRERGWGGARPGSGPKPRPAAETRRRAVLVRLTDAELAPIERGAQGAALGTWVRETALRAARRRSS